MIDLYRKILESYLFPLTNEHEYLVFIPDAQFNHNYEKQFTGNWTLPTGLFPSHCKVRKLSDDEAFIDEL